MVYFVAYLIGFFKKAASKKSEQKLSPTEIDTDNIHIKETIIKNEGEVEKVVFDLGISREELFQKMQDYNLDFIDEAI